jgi:hypothetical protein
MVTTPFSSSAEYVTPQRMGGRVAPTKSTSAVNPGAFMWRVFQRPANLPLP